METTMVPFHDDVIEALYDAKTSTIYVVCKRVAENLGLEWSSQSQVLRGHELLSAKLICVDINIDQGQRQIQVAMVCLPLKYLPLWLAGIQTKRVRHEIRAKLLLYQEECADVLARYFLGDGVVVNTQAPVRSTMDIIKQMHQEQGLLIQQVERHEHLIETSIANIADLQANKVDKSDYERDLLKQRSKDALRQWHAMRKFPDWVKEWIWAHAGGRCMNPACRRELDPSPQAPPYKRPQYDHVLSKEDGGMGTIDNCQLLCAECNNAKRGMYMDHRPGDLRKDTERLAAERQAEREREEEKRRRQQDFGFWP